MEFPGELKKKNAEFPGMIRKQSFRSCGDPWFLPWNFQKVYVAAS